MVNGNAVVKQAYGKLILVITHKCNYSCIYCPVPKAENSMSFGIAKSAVDIFFSDPVKEKQIRFFGGEPLLEFPLLKRVVSYAQKKNRESSLEFDVTTGGDLLTKDKIKFFKNNPQIELVISLDGNRQTQLLNRKSVKRKKLDSYQRIVSLKKELLGLATVTVNMVISPNQVSNFFLNFEHIISLGFRRINFLPAFFLFWDSKSLMQLREGFEKVFTYLRKHKEPIYVKNIDVFGEAPLFNKAFVVDCDGDIFDSNLFFSQQFSKFRKYLVLGNVQRKKKFTLGEKNILEFIEKETDSLVLESTQRADSILTEFVKKVKDEKGRY